MAQCALLDEIALRHLGEHDKVEWAARPLQVSRFNKHDAGEFVFERLNARMHEAPPNVDLLECYAMMLGLGFMGRYALEGSAKRDALIARLTAQIAPLRPARQPGVLVDRQAPRPGDWFHRVLPWAIAGLCVAMTLTVWLAWRIALDAQLVSVIPQAVKP